MVRNWALAAAAVATIGATAAQASESDAVKQTVRTWLAKFNSGDGAGALAMCSDSGSIIDEFAPFRWTRFEDWFKAYDAYAAANHISNSTVKVNKFSHVNVDGGHAYVVANATYAYKENGKPRIEHAWDVLTLEKLDSGWRITSAAWFGKNGADAGADATAVANTVNTFVSLSAPASPPVAIVDEFAPYHWEGTSANADWSGGLSKLMAAGGETDLALKLDRPSQLSVNGDTAYAVYPTVITSKHHGRPEAEHGGFAFTLKKQSDAWQIMSWAWATK